MPLLNVRDVAIETSLRPDVLYRSAQPHTLTPEDARLVADLRLTCSGWCCPTAGSVRPSGGR
ncbi:hypothetical protein ACIA8R_40765 [Nonomuraea sp. NPDC051191]|uniref:hypothetical protein n=1 Tax=Nonomuraea sp. NPDC051191 TaxID=3364372 RepID=UPI0037A18899